MPDPEDHLDDEAVEAALRWRLVLGRFAEEQVGFGSLGPGVEGGAGGGGAAGGDLAGLLAEGRSLDLQLEYIYDREYQERSHRAKTGQGGGGGLSVPVWVRQVRDLFPQEAVEVMERDALTRYGLTELVTDPEILRKAEPSEALLRAILQFKHQMKGEVLEVAREVVQEVVEVLAAEIMRDTHAALHGTTDPESLPPKRTFRNVDWRRTIQRNLKNWDVEEDRLVVDRVFFKHRQQKKSDWRIIVSVDQSGSMLDNLIHSSIMAAIFTALPAVEVNLVLWDHRIVDMSHAAHDPLQVLMGTQLGGGNDDQAAMEYCAGLVSDPLKTILVVISDWYICVPEPPLLALAHELHEAGITCIGLSALDRDAKAVYNEDHARKLAGVGWYVAALTPKQLAEHVGKIIAG